MAAYTPKCRKSLAHGIRIVTRCSAIMDEGVFNEVYIDPNSAPLLAFPADGEDAPNTVEQLVMERIWKQEVWAENISNQKDLTFEKNRFKKRTCATVRSGQISYSENN